MHRFRLKGKSCLPGSCLANQLQCVTLTTLLDTGYDPSWEAPAELSLFRCQIWPVSIHLKWRTSSASPFLVIRYPLSVIGKSFFLTDYGLPFTDYRKKGRALSIPGQNCPICNCAKVLPPFPEADNYEHGAGTAVSHLSLNQL